MIDGKNKCFRNYGDNFNNKAAPYCESENSRLPLPKNSQENSDFSKVAQSLLINGGFFALDANDVEKEGEWRSSEYQLVNYTNFKPAADNYGGVEDFVITDGLGNWGDVKPYFPVETICEKDAQVSGTSGK